MPHAHGDVEQRVDECRRHLRKRYFCGVKVHAPRCGWQAQEIRPQQCKDSIGDLEIHAAEKRIHGPRAEDIRKADPDANLPVHAVFSSEQQRHGHERKQDAFLMNLPAEEKEAPCSRCKGERHRRLAWPQEDDEVGRDDGEKGGDGGSFLQQLRRVVLDLDDHVESAPEVGDFVFEEAAGEREDTVDHLHQLVDHGIVDGLGIQILGDAGKDGQRRRCSVKLWASVNPAVGIVQGPQNKREDQNGKAGNGDQGKDKESSDVEGEETPSQEIGEDGEGVVQCHLLESQRGNEEDSRPHVTLSQQTRHASQHEAQHDSVVLEVYMIDEDRRRLHQDGDEGN